MLTVLLSALELGLLYAPVALALFLSYRMLNIADLTTDGSFTLGCAVSATVALAGHPILAIAAACLSGAAAGGITALLQTKLRVPSILAGIITNTGLYTVNLAVMGFSSNVTLLRAETVFSLSGLPEAAVAAIPAVLSLLFLLYFLRTRLGLSIRATGDNADMVRASSINPHFTITVGLCIANGLTAMSGALFAQYQRSADVNLGTGMVVIGLASLIIGQSLFPKRKLGLQLLGALVGSLLYRTIIAIAIHLDLPSEYLKLISAVIVAAAIAVPAMGKKGKKYASD